MVTREGGGHTAGVATNMAEISGPSVMSQGADKNACLFVFFLSLLILWISVTGWQKHYLYLVILHIIRP